MYLDTIAMAKRLEGPYKEVFEKADMYGMFGTDEHETNEKMMDLFDMLMEAQEDGKPVEKIVGDDLEEFCKNFFRDQRILNNINIFQWLYRIVWIGMLLVILDLWDFYQMKSPDVSIWDMETEASPVLVGTIVGVAGGFLLAGCIKYILQPLVFKNKKMKPIVYNTIFIVAYIITLGLAICFIWQFDIQLWISSTWMLVVLAGYISVYLIVCSVLRYRKHGTILRHDKKQKKAEKKELETFNKEIAAKQERNDTAKIMAKRFKRLQKKYERKGNGVYTQEMFAKKIRQEENFFAKPTVVWTFDILLTIAIGAYPFINIIKTDGLWTGVTFAAFFLIVELLIFRFFNKTINEVSVEKLDILDQCEALGIDIVTYAENTLEITDEHGVS